MALPGQPTNALAQPGNQMIYLTWAPVIGATSYTIMRSLDGLTFTSHATLVPVNLQPEYTDTSLTNTTHYYYQILAVNGSGSGPASQTVDEWPVKDGTLVLGQIRRQARQRADQVNSQFLTTQEWNQNIYDSVSELYDLLISCFGQEYYVATPYQFTTAGGSTQLYDLPADFYKLLGVDAAITASTNAWLTLKRFNFISRNRYVFPQMGSTFLGITSLRYRIVGNQLMFIPAPVSSQTLQLWYVPRPKRPLKENDLVDGFSGWLEYVIIDAAIKAMQKEESDVTVLAAQKQAMIDRINTIADNRDLGEPETVSDSRGSVEAGGWGPGNGDGPFGGYAWAGLILAGSLLLKLAPMLAFFYT